MTTTYIQRSDTSDLSGGGEYSRKLLEGAAAVSDLVIALAASETKTGHSFTEAGVPGVNGVTGDYTVEVDIAVGDNQVLISVAIGRVNSVGTLQSESAFSAEQTAAGAVLTFNFTAVNLGTWAAGDRLRVAVRYRNQHTHTARNVTVSFNTVESEVIAPWTITGPQTVTAVTLTVTPTLPAARIDQAITAGTLTVTPSLPAAEIVVGGLSAVSRLNEYNTTGGDTFTTAGTVAFTAGRWYIACVDTRKSATPAAPATVASPSNSFVLENPGGLAVDPVAGQDGNMSLWLVKAGTTETAAITVAGAGGESWTGVGIHVVEIDGGDADDIIEGTLASAVVANDTTLSTTLAAFVGSGDRPFFFGGTPGENDPITPEAGYTDLGQNEELTPDGQTIVAWHATTQDTTPSFSWPLSNGAGILAVKLKAAGGGDSVGHVTLVVIPSLPVARIDQVLTAQVLLITPSLPIAVITLPIDAVLLTVTPTLPIAQIEHSIQAQTLTVTPTLPPARLDQAIEAATLSVTPTLPLATVTPVVNAVTLSVVPSLPIAQLDQSLTAVTLAVVPTLPLANVTLPVNAVTLQITPTLPPALRFDQSINAVTLSVTPTLPPASITTLLDAVTLEITPTLPPASIATALQAVTLAITPTLPAAQIAQALTAVLLQATPTLPIASISTAEQILAVTLTISPMLPAANLSTQLLAATLNIVPSLPLATVETAISAATLSTTPTLPTASLETSISAQTLIVTPTLPAARIDQSINAQTHTVVPTLPPASIATANQILAVTLVVTPTLPIASIDSVLTAVTLSVTPTLPPATVTASDDVLAQTLVMSPTLPVGRIDQTIEAAVLQPVPILPQASISSEILANTVIATPQLLIAAVETQVGAQLLALAPTLPPARLDIGIFAASLEITPSLPPASVIHVGGEIQEFMHTVIVRRTFLGVVSVDRTEVQRTFGGGIHG